MAICCVLGIYGVLFVIGASRDLWWELHHGTREGRYWSQNVLGRIGSILIGLVLVAAAPRWLTAIVRTRPPRGRE